MTNTIFTTYEFETKMEAELTLMANGFEKSHSANMMNTRVTFYKKEGNPIAAQLFKMKKSKTYTVQTF